MYPVLRHTARKYHYAVVLSCRIVLDIAPSCFCFFNDNCSCKSKALGFTWDNSDCAAEYTALQNAYSQYGKQVAFGFVEPEEGIAELESALKAAGLDDYMQAKQDALDAWAEENNIQ